MKKSFTLRFLCLALVAVMTFGLCACPAGDPVTGTTGTSGTSGTTGGNASGHPDDVTDALYADGATLTGAGAEIAEGSFVLTVPTPDEANAEEILNIAMLFRGGTPEAGKTYKLLIDTPSPMSGTDKVFDFGGATVIAPYGVEINGAAGLTVRNLTLVGALTVKGSENVTFENVAVLSADGTAVTVAEDVAGISFNVCRLEGATALQNAADGIALTDCAVIFTETGISDSAARGTAVMNCIFRGEGTAIATAADYTQIRQSSFELSSASVGISLSGGMNTLIAQNVLKGAQKSMVISDVLNTAVVLNSAVTVIGENTSSLYVCDNSLGGRLRFENNDYLLADGNTFPEDGLDHSTLQTGSTNHNGDSLMDVDARLEYGADENLLPHTDKDLFVGMERLDTVRVGATDVKMRADDYVSTAARTSDTVILAPGAYAVASRLDFSASNSNTTVYAYGAYFERDRELTQGSTLGNMLHFVGASNVTLKGCTVGFERQSCGQVYILDKLANNKLLVVTGAGMDNEFGNTDTTLYNTRGIGAHRAGEFYAFCDTSFNTINKRSDGLMEMSVSSSVYEMLEEGDVLTCRSVQGNNTVFIHSSSAITLKDVTVYGNSGAFMALEQFNLTSTTYYRLHNTTKNGAIIDKDTYDYYRSLEEQYGVSLHISVDEQGRYRGSLPHIGSIDATHVAGCAEGSHATSCIFENMCDDATNQKHTHARIHDLIDNGDGTTTIVYKGNYATTSHDGGGGTGGGGYCYDFRVGDRVFAYNSEGRLLCDTPALTVTEAYIEGGVHQSVFLEEKYNRYCQANNLVSANKSQFMSKLYLVTVATADVNFDTVAGYNLASNDHVAKDKVLLDNMSMASNGFFFDNCLEQNIRSRGLLIKASNGTIRNCTFRNIGMSCAAILYEIYWGESGASENLVIDRNLMDHTGYFNNIDRYSPISVEGLGNGKVDPDYLLYKNIQITNNVMRNRTTDYGVFLQATCDVTVTGNDFGYFAEGESEEHFSRAIKINGAMNVKIEDNTYAPTDLTMLDYITPLHYKNLYGADVYYEGNPIFPDEE